MDYVDSLKHEWHVFLEAILLRLSSVMWQQVRDVSQQCGLSKDLVCYFYGEHGSVVKQAEEINYCLLSQQLVP